ncbi:hypothetical protein KR018_001401, partial [Drosophila ironensis]
LSKMENYPWSAEVMRELYESWLILFVGLLMQWNPWRLTGEPQSLSTYLEPQSTPRDSQTRWADVWFAAGVLCIVLQYRSRWAHRCRHQIRLYLLAVEVLFWIHFVEQVDRELWSPTMDLLDDVAYSVTVWGRSHPEWIFHILPWLITWMQTKASGAFRLAASFGWFLCALDGVAAEWRRAFEFVLMGGVPLHPAAKRRYLRRQARMSRIHRNGSPSFGHAYPPYNPSDNDIAHRFCKVCMAEIGLRVNPPRQ